MTTVEVLRAARKLIEDPKDWWEGDQGEENGRECAALAIRTVCEGNDTLECAVIPILARAMGGDCLARIYAFNDSHSHAEVLAAFDRAIENELAREGEWTARPSVGAPDSLPVA